MQGGMLHRPARVCCVSPLRHGDRTPRVCFPSCKHDPPGAGIVASDTPVDREVSL